MWQTKKILVAVAWFVVIYGLLIFPWPGWNEIYGGYFRALGEAAFRRSDGQRIVMFESADLQHGFTTLNTRMRLGNRALVDSTGHGQAKSITLDTRSIGWTPTALIVALILATPVRWRQRGWALLWGLLLVHAFILFTLQVWIWDESSALSLMTTPAFLQTILDAMVYTLITQLGASFSVPILIWILVTIRRENLFDFPKSGAADRK